MDYPTIPTTISPDNRGNKNSVWDRNTLLSSLNRQSESSTFYYYCVFLATTTTVSMLQTRHFYWDSLMSWSKCLPLLQDNDDMFHSSWLMHTIILLNRVSDNNKQKITRLEISRRLCPGSSSRGGCSSG